MRLEQVPLFMGVVVAILGLGMVLDAQLPDSSSPSRERRRRERAERHRGGETLVGVGIMAVAAALIGRDTWRFGTISVLAGAVLVAAGGWLNRAFLREMFLFRGAARRGEKRGAARADAPAAVTRGRSDVHVVPGLADAPPRRAPGVRGDREAPIMTAADGLPKRGGSVGEDTPPDGQPRLRIR
ncbi:MAG TPA: hypothetical protein VM076_14350 [Gemmatimonadaceae bacterium]|nr:hypothetical protein [Gemmatimonadaceae bacterium]